MNDLAIEAIEIRLRLARGDVQIPAKILVVDDHQLMRTDLTFVAG